MKIWCIVFERELEGKEVIHVKQDTKPTNDEAEDLVENAGYMFNKGYDEIKRVFEVS